MATNTNVSLSINYADLERCADTLDSAKGHLKDKLATIKAKMDIVNSEGADVYFSSDAAACIEKFSNMYNKRMPEFDDVIAQYASFLRDAVAAYKQTNDALGNDVESNINAFIG